VTAVIEIPTTIVAIADAKVIERNEKIADTKTNVESEAVAEAVESEIRGHPPLQGLVEGEAVLKKAPGQNKNNAAHFILFPWVQSPM
jgi:hypothetical protein